MTDIQTEEIELDIGHFYLKDISCSIPTGKITKWFRKIYDIKTDHAFREAHSRDGGGRPEYILDNKISYYEVKIVRNPIVPA